jgi:acetolactate synthase-1/2/3 large subunit
MTSGGHLLVRCLEAQEVDRIFCVPGESYLDVLDGLHDSGIAVITARQEGGAAMMAEADGKLTGRPGVAMVTRGPGAANAAAGVHVAQQDSTPMILFIGQVDRTAVGRDAFQEVDYRTFYGAMAKAVMQIDEAARIPEIVSRAFHLAMSGRPGPVVVPLPEDMLRQDVFGLVPVARAEVAEPAPTPESIDRFTDLLSSAARPFLLLGGSRWTARSAAAARSFAERWWLPTGCQFRRQMLFDPRHGHYAGEVGLGANPALLQRIRNADLLVLLGGRLPEVASGGYTLLGVPEPDMTLVHVHPGPEELGRVYHASLQINATPGAFLAAVNDRPVPPAISSNDGRRTHVEEAHRAYEAWSTAASRPELRVDIGRIMHWLRNNLPSDAVVCNGAGNHTQWLHRYYHYRGFGTQLAPTSGSMGYGLPAAVAAKLRHPERTVVCVTGDGCFQMTGLELATAAQFDAPVIVLLFDNGMHGTIRMHQERLYPGRVTATDLVNPDFVALARACGAHGEVVTATGGFEPAFERALSHTGLGRGPSLLHIKTDPEAITPAETLDDIRNRSEEQS